MWETLLDNHIFIFLWWVAIVLSLGILFDRVIHLIQRVAIKLYANISGNPRWYVTIAQVISWVARVILWIVIVATIASRLGIPPGLITALGTVLGAAVGFGSQDIVKDIIKGSINLLEKQFSVGDYASFVIGGQEYEGTIEEVNLRTVIVSTENDGRVSVPQGQVTVVKNYNRIGDFVMSIPIEIDSDFNLAIIELEKASQKILNQEFDIEGVDISDDDKTALANAVDIIIRGVGGVSNGAINIQIKGVAVPGQQFGVKRALNNVFNQVLDQHGIKLKNIVIIQKGAV